MRKLNAAVDRFCYAHPRLAIPNLMMYIVLANVAVYFMDFMSSGTFSAMLDFVPAYIFQGQVWRLITFVFVPENSSNLLFFLIGCWFDYYVGSSIERQWGATRFTVFYLSGVVLNIVVGLILGFAYGGTACTMVTASMYYVNLSLFFAFASLFPNAQVLLMFIIPVKVKWIAYLDAALLLWYVLSYLLQGAFLFALLPVLATLNYLAFFGDDLMTALWGRRQSFVHRHSKQTINFKKAAKQVNQERGYVHKCCVCGRTDADDPNLEFRYCSRCSGYRCYCMDHINNHVHITDD